MFDNIRWRNHWSKTDFSTSLLYTQAHTDTWAHAVFHWLTNTAVVVAGQLVTWVALTVVRTLCVHTSVCAVVGRGTLVSVCRETHTHRVTNIWAISQVTSDDERRHSEPLHLGTSFNHVLRRRRRHVTNPHSGHPSAGSRRDTGRCRSLWSCSTSVQDHKCAGRSHIHLCLQQTRTSKHWEGATHKFIPTALETTCLATNHYVWTTWTLWSVTRELRFSHRQICDHGQHHITHRQNTHVRTESVALNKRGPLFCSSGWGGNHRSYLLLTGQLFEEGRGCVRVCVCKERKSSLTW